MKREQTDQHVAEMSESDRLPDSAPVRRRRRAPAAARRALSAFGDVPAGMPSCLCGPEESCALCAHESDSGEGLAVYDDLAIACNL